MSEIINISTESDDVLPYHLVLIPGAFHTGSTFDPLCDELSEHVNGITPITFERSDPEVTINSDVNQIVETVGSRDNIVVVCWSRGVEAAIRLPQALDPEQLHGLVICSSGGPQAYRLPMELHTGAVNPRYNGEYTEGMVQRADGFLEYSPDFARRYIYNDLDEAAAQKAIDGMVLQPHYVNSKFTEYWDHSIPTKIFLGQADLAIDRARARAVGRRLFGQHSWVIEEGSHAFHYSKPEVLGRHLLTFLRQELDDLED